MMDEGEFEKVEKTIDVWYEGIWLWELTSS